MNTTLKQIGTTDYHLTDCHSGLETCNGKLFQANCARDLQRLMAHAARHGQKVITHGGRHAMGGQQMQERAL
ncbi:MAG TPA: hypothetical protein PLI59_22150, partial [Candidatus Obscuribacter sp.]|nr:hypothetical protein [Candidatus Obscuribacter sp.]